MANYRTATIEAENTFTEQMFVEPGGFNLSISGTFVATVFVQRSFGGGSWGDVASYTTPIEDVGTEPEGALYRVGVKTGGFTSGTVNVRLGQ